MPPAGNDAAAKALAAAAAKAHGDDAAHKYSKSDSCGICFAIFLFLWFTPLSIVFTYHAAPSTVIALAFIWAGITLMPWLFHAGGVVGADFSGPMLTVTMFMSVVMSFLGGVRCYYEHAQPMRQLALARTYTGVYPELPGISFPDASYIEFAGNTSIDFSKAVSFQSLDSGLSTICVAPLKSAVSTGRHDFWAIGVGCCGDNGDKFDCYDAGDASVRTGWVLPSKFRDKLFTKLGVWVTKAEYRRDLFVKALQKAEATYGITTPGENAVLLRWTRQTKADIVYWETINVVITVVLFAVGLGGLSIFMMKLYERFQHTRHLHRMQHHFGIHGDKANSEEEDVTARMQQFVADSLDQDRDIADHALALHTIQVQNKKDLQEHLKKFRPPLSAVDMCIMGVALPYVMLMCCVIFSTYSPCTKYGHLVLAPFWCMTVIFILALLATPHRTFSGLFLLICCTAGCYIGTSNFKNNMFHYCSVGDRRLYTDVKPDASTADYWDAGRLNFDSSTVLSTNHSVGYKYQGTTFCAAPVISTNVVCMDGSPSVVPHGSSVDPPSEHEQYSYQASDTSFMQIDSNNASEVSGFGNEDGKMLTTDASPAMTFMQSRSSRHHTRRAHTRRTRSTADMLDYGGCKNIAPTQTEFWAIGVDCCDARNNFWCDGGDLKNARQAVVVRAFGDEDNEGPKIESDRKQFYQAIDQAVATYNLPEPTRPVLLHWGMNSDHLRTEWKKKAISLIMMTGLATLLIITLISITAFCFMKHERLLEKNMEQKWDKHQGIDDDTVYDAARTVYDTARASLTPMSAADLERRFNEMG